MVALGSVVSSAPSGRTSAEGIVLLRALPGTYDLMIIGPDRERIERKLTVGRASTQTLSLTLE